MQTDTPLVASVLPRAYEVQFERLWPDRCDYSVLRVKNVEDMATWVKTYVFMLGTALNWDVGKYVDTKSDNSDNDAKKAKVHKITLKTRDGYPSIALARYVATSPSTIYLEMPINHGASTGIGTLNGSGSPVQIITNFFYNVLTKQRDSSYTEPRTVPAAHLIRTAAFILRDTISADCRALFDTTGTTEGTKVHTETFFVPTNTEHLANADASAVYLSRGFVKQSDKHNLVTIAGTMATRKNMHVAVEISPHTKSVKDPTHWRSRVCDIAAGWSPVYT